MHIRFCRDLMLYLRPRYKRNFKSCNNLIKIQNFCFTAYEFWSVEDHPNKFYYRQVDFWFGMAGYILLRFSECLNPLFYNIGSPVVYKHSKMFVQTKLCCCFKTKQAETPKEKHVRGALKKIREIL